MNYSEWAWARTLLLVLVVLCVSAAAAARVLSEEEGFNNNETNSSSRSAPHAIMAAYPSVYETAKSAMECWLGRLTSGPSPSGPGH
ncbi:hypothetical protein ACLOJK_008933 [Asimina triloba]